MRPSRRETLETQRRMANFGLVPFAARLMSTSFESSLAAIGGFERAWIKPGHPEQLTAEAVASLVQIIERATLGALVERGWRAKREFRQIRAWMRSIRSSKPIASAWICFSATT